MDIKHLQKRHIVRSEDVFAAVQKSIEKNPYEPIHLHAQLLELCLSTLWPKNLLQNPARAELKSNNSQRRRTFGDWIQNELVTDPGFHKNVNFCGTQATVETPSQSSKSHCLVCSMDRRNDWFICISSKMKPATMLCYRVMINGFFVPEMDDIEPMKQTIY